MAKIDYQAIYDIVKLIPSGRISTYGAIANVLGYKGAARVVGYAMNLSHSQEGIPAHRVVNRKGLLTGRHHFETPDTMQRLLEKEGIKVQDHQVLHFEQLFWDPQQEL